MPEFEKKPLDPINPVDVRVAAMNLLARREHSRQELFQKLRRRFKDERIVDEQIERLATENLQSDERYAHSFVRQRIARGHGPLRITMDARQRGVCSALLDTALEENAPDWSEHAQAVMLKKFGDEQVVDVKSKARRIRFMQYRGFSMEHFASLLDF